MKTEIVKRLLPCPFCGGNAHYLIIDQEEDPRKAGGEYIECTNCGASTNITIPLMDVVTEIVIEKWNRRTKPKKLK